MVNEESTRLRGIGHHARQHLRQMAQHRIRLPIARQQAADTRAALLVVDAFDERAGHFDQQEIEPALQVGPVIIGEVADVDRAGIKIVRRRVIALQDAAAVAATQRHAHEKATIGRRRFHAAELSGLGALAVERQSAPVELLVHSQLAGRAAQRVGGPRRHGFGYQELGGGH